MYMYNVYTERERLFKNNIKEIFNALKYKY